LRFNSDTAGMNIKSAAYMGSFPREAICPKDGKPEYAFIGRSNVGKSSLINMLCNRKELARVSNKPGKTQTLNFYLINETWYLVDLPGYGFAKVSKKTRDSWGKMIEQYLLERKTLQCAFVLIDANIPPQKIDLEFINWLGQKGVPFVLLFTKTDRMSKLQCQRQIELFQKALLQHWETLPQHFVTSALTNLGREDILGYIANINKANE